MNFTTEQNEAINKRGTNIIVSAGAGSGKTKVLTERVISLLKEGIHIDELLILTFTNQASLEMKDRILKRIKEENLKEELSRIDSAYITTFDSFALSLVKKYHYKKNISPSLKIIDSNILNLVKKDILDNILEEKYQNDTNFKEFIRNFATKNDTEIRNNILKLNENLDLLINKEDYLNNYFEKYYNNDFKKYVEEKYNDYVNNKIENIKDLTEELKIYLSSDDIDKINDSLINIFSHNFKAFNRLPIIKSDLEIVSNIKENIKKEINDLKNIEDFDTEYNNYLLTKENVKVIIDIIKKLDEEIKKYKYKYDLYEFTDISLLAISLLDDNDIKEELKAHFKQIMIDEYQDTNDIQEYFISKIENNNVYMVGDIKQSIYRFRNANPYIFKEKYDNYKNNNNGIKIDLNKNFRSREQVIDNINTIFNKIMDDRFGGADYLNEHQMSFGNLEYKSHDNPTSNYSFICYDEKEKSTLKEATIIASSINNYINSDYQMYDKNSKKLRKVKYSDFVILLDRMTDIDTYIKVFEEYHLPLNAIRDEKISDNELLLIINNIVKYLKDENDIYKTSILRSFLFEKNDSEIFDILSNNKETEFDIKIGQIKKELNNISPKMLIDEIIKTFNIYEKLPLIGNILQNNKIIDYLLDLSYSLEEIGYNTNDFIDYLEKMEKEKLDLKISSGMISDNAINIMTIHKSKGLEFPICYYAGLYKKFNISDLNEKFLFDNNYGIITPFIKDGICESVIKKLVKENYIKEEISEKIRLFYVALTRAEEKMIFVTPNFNSEKHYSNYEKNNIRSFYDILNIIFKVIEKNIETIDLKTFKDEKIELQKCNENILVNEIKIQEENNEIKTFSKENVKILTNEEKEKMKYGRKIHKIFELENFLNPSNELVLNLVNKIPNIKDAIIYKEYEFKTNKYHGIIDLMLEYNDHIDIIDYKLKNIIDDAYINQLNGYKEHIEKISGKHVSIYLYSIIDNDLKQIKK